MHQFVVSATRFAFLMSKPLTLNISQLAGRGFGVAADSQASNCNLPLFVVAANVRRCGTGCVTGVTLASAAARPLSDALLAVICVLRRGAAATQRGTSAATQ